MRCAKHSLYGFAVPFFLPKKYLIYKQQEFITV
ncbi:tetR family transcriptional regulator domain protein, partial [Acinetobacter baumannii 855125]